MKKLSTILLGVAALLVAVACVRDNGEEQTAAEQQTEQQEPQEIVLEGVAVGGAHASIIVEDSVGNEHEFSYPDLDASKRDSWEEGDLVEITYTQIEYNNNMLDSVIALRNLSQHDAEQAMHQLPKLRAAGSSPVYRSNNKNAGFQRFLLLRI